MARKQPDPAVAWDEVRREWRARVVAEYHSAAFTTELLSLLVRLGAPYDLLFTAHRIIKDELVHAERSYAVLASAGGEDEKVPLEEATLKLPAYAESPFDQAVLTALSSFCLGETFAVPLFRGMYRKTTAAKPRAALRRILRDESVHREFGWQLLDYFLSRDEERTRALAERALPGFLADYERGYGLSPDGAPEPVGEREEALGLMPRARYVAIFREALRQVIFPRFSRRGIDARTAWERRAGEGGTTLAEPPGPPAG